MGESDVDGFGGGTTTESAEGDGSGAGSEESALPSVCPPTRAFLYAFAPTNDPTPTTSAAMPSANTRFRVVFFGGVLRESAESPASVVASVGSWTIGSCRFEPVVDFGTPTERGICPPSAAASVSAISFAVLKRSGTGRAHARWNHASTAGESAGLIFEASGSGSE